MHFSSLNAFFYMGGYADYVWPAFSIVLGLLLINTLISFSQLRKIVKMIRKRYESST